MIKKTTLPLLICLLFNFAAITAVAQKNNSSNQIIFLHNAWSQALKQAAAQHKLIFVDAYASWCGPCQLLKATTFKNNKAAAFYNENFINLALDMEQGTGPQLARQWGMRAYPTLIIFDERGNIILNTVGFIGAGDLIRFGQEAIRRSKNAKS